LPHVFVWHLWNVLMDASTWHCWTHANVAAVAFRPRSRILFIN